MITDQELDEMLWDIGDIYNNSEEDEKKLIKTKIKEILDFFVD